MQVWHVPAVLWGDLNPLLGFYFPPFSTVFPWRNSIRVAICGKECNQNAVLSRALFICRFGAGALGPAKHWPRTLADQFPGRWLLAFGCWAVKIDTLETVPPHVDIAAGLGREAILLKVRSPSA